MAAQDAQNIELMYISAILYLILRSAMAYLIISITGWIN